MIVVSVPSRFETEHLRSFCADLNSAIDVADVSVDFSYLNYSKPIAMLIAGSQLRRWALHRRNNGFISRAIGVDLNRSVHSYLDHIGFFEYILMGGVNPIGAARGSSSYVPITRVTRPAFDPSEHSLRQWYESNRPAITPCQSASSCAAAVRAVWTGGSLAGAPSHP